MNTECVEIKYKKEQKERICKEEIEEENHIFMKKKIQEMKENTNLRGNENRICRNKDQKERNCKEEIEEENYILMKKKIREMNKNINLRRSKQRIC